jgi:hypothetical protein
MGVGCGRWRTSEIRSSKRRDQIDHGFSEPSRQLAQDTEQGIAAVLRAVEGLGDEFSKFRTEVTSEIDEIKDRLTLEGRTR